MTEPVPRAVVEAFYQALAACDMDTLAGYLDDDVVWTISGPIDVLPFCGQRRARRWCSSCSTATSRRCCTSGVWSPTRSWSMATAPPFSAS